MTTVTHVQSVNMMPKDHLVLQKPFLVEICHAVNVQDHFTPARTLILHLAGVPREHKLLEWDSSCAPTATRIVWDVTYCTQLMGWTSPKWRITSIIKFDAVHCYVDPKSSSWLRPLHTYNVGGKRWTLWFWQHRSHHLGLHGTPVDEIQ